MGGCKDYCGSRNGLRSTIIFQVLSEDSLYVSNNGGWNLFRVRYQVADCRRISLCRSLSKETSSGNSADRVVHIERNVSSSSNVFRRPVSLSTTRMTLYLRRPYTRTSDRSIRSDQKITRYVSTLLFQHPPFRPFGASLLIYQSKIHVAMKSTISSFDQNRSNF